MDRRSALRLLAATLVAPRFLQWEPEALIDGLRAHLGHNEHAGVPYEFQALDPHQRAMVAEISEMIIPATDTPGAKAAKVDEFIDLILADWCSTAERTDFLAGLAALDGASMQAYRVGFLDALPGQGAELLRDLDAQLTAARAASKAWRSVAGPKPPDHRKLFWHQMRSLTVTGYYASEVGYTLERQNVLIPGIYKACTPIPPR